MYSIFISHIIWNDNETIPLCECPDRLFFREKHDLQSSAIGSNLAKTEKKVADWFACPLMDGKFGFFKAAFTSFFLPALLLFLSVLYDIVESV